MNTKYTISLLLALTTMQATGNTVVATESVVRKQRVLDRKQEFTVLSLDKKLRPVNRGKDYNGVPILTAAQFATATGLRADDPRFLDRQTANKVLTGLNALRSDDAIKILMGSGNTVSAGQLDALLGNALGQATSDNVEDILNNLATTKDDMTGMAAAPAAKMVAVTTPLDAGKDTIYGTEDNIQAIIALQDFRKALNSQGDIKITGLAVPGGAAANAFKTVSRKLLVAAVSEPIGTYTEIFQNGINGLVFDRPVQKALNLTEILSQFKVGANAAGFPAAVVAALHTPANAAVDGVGLREVDTLIDRYKTVVTTKTDPDAIAATAALSANVAATIPAVFATERVAAQQVGTYANYAELFSGGYLRPLIGKIDDLSTFAINEITAKKKFAAGQSGTYTKDDLVNKMNRLQNSTNTVLIKGNINAIFNDFTRKNIQTAEQKELAENEVARIAAFLEKAAKDANENSSGTAKIFGAKKVELKQIEELKDLFKTKSDKFKKDMESWVPSAEKNADDKAKKEAQDNLNAATASVKKLTDKSDDKAFAAAVEQLRKLDDAGKKKALEVVVEAKIVEKLNADIKTAQDAEKAVEAEKEAAAKAKEEAEKEAAKKAKNIEDLKIKVAKPEIANQKEEIASIVAQFKTINLDGQKAVLDAAHTDVRKAVEAALQAEAAKAAAEKAAAEKAAAAEAAKKLAPAQIKGKTSTSGNRGRGNARRGNARKGKQARARAGKGRNPRQRIAKRITKRMNTKKADKKVEQKVTKSSS